MSTVDERKQALKMKLDSGVSIFDPEITEEYISILKQEEEETDAAMFTKEKRVRAYNMLKSFK